MLHVDGNEDTVHGVETYATARIVADLLGGAS
ncbi:hypothetical protein SAMN05421867_1072 [Cellulomonas marina]|uniref:Uncharacterized protein n=1 Tax=Cellulomonas marina TaxID=988821 RepID=A0A1I0YA56_9CELL|nr:hypothetical protein SAMN05421867_1072 [Cellulomonas marina]